MFYWDSSPLSLLSSKKTGSLYAQIQLWREHKKKSYQIHLRKNCNIFLKYNTIKLGMIKTIDSHSLPGQKISVNYGLLASISLF